MLKEKIVNIETGEVSFREYTETEMAEVEKAIKEGKVRAQAEADAISKKAAVEAKLAALGLDADDLRALGL